MNTATTRRIWRPGLLAAWLLVGPTAAAAQDYAPGEKLTIINCGRCHVVSARNRMGGIGSTPSFAALRTFDDWEARMKAFWTYRPHPAFTQIEGITEPFPEHRPAHIHPISLTLEELAAIINYARTVKPAELGPDLGLN
jgi:hypothetical protein